MDEAVAKVIELYELQLKPIEEKIAPLLEQRAAKRKLINALCVDAGAPPRYPDTEGDFTPARAATLPVQSPDEFTGKGTATAARAILQRRRAQGSGPISQDELYSALKAGGFDFEGKNETNAIISITTTLGKNVEFRKVPGSGLWGLSEWYGGPVRRQKKPDEPSTGNSTAPVAKEPAEDATSNGAKQPEAQAT